MKIKHAKIKLYMRYIAELVSDELFLMWKFKKLIIFNVKISQSPVS